ncbi:hypothetical protein RHMOL_Rhmol06G0287600 [Rhododendron molle]|uniref:Uncharacterized protein n=1 Tax=Rhododendron molle TaxID=49168 RepID=A0ACC0NIG5_RHOML|nr:hypothetical protein RHMOL_Rhmol06G0287600 [Rhododendron molle]
MGSIHFRNGKKSAILALANSPILFIASKNSRPPSECGSNKSLDSMRLPTTLKLMRKTKWVNSTSPDPPRARDANESSSIHRVMLSTLFCLTAAVSLTRLLTRSSAVHSFLSDRQYVPWLPMAIDPWL